MIVALAGGVGGAKLASGLAELLGSRLSVIVNTADDFEHLGLHISPDLDTIMYTLAGIANPVTGWGVADESWAFLDQLTRFGGPNWFKLGDRDLAVHILRTAALRRGERLTSITAGLCGAAGIASAILPMCDSPVRTIIKTPEGELPFQDYFVRLRCEPRTVGIEFAGADTARATTEVVSALTAPDLEAIILCPSNPFVSIDPVLAVPPLRRLLQEAKVPVVGVSPIIGGEAVKGPAAKMLDELGFEVSALSVAVRYRDILTAFVIDPVDSRLAAAIANMGIAVTVAPILMIDAATRRGVAARCLSLAGSERS
jgi:LPPG:FO 2-phospho-L-lactate transferase